MDRIKFLIDSLEINQTQALIINKLIADIPDNLIVDFIVFRMNYIEPMQSKELITKTALFEFRKKQYLQSIQNGKFVFNSVDEVIDFCKTYFKNKDLCYGAANFFDYVVFAIDKDGCLLNKYKLTEQGNYTKLDSFDEIKVYNWLFENQNRIGVVKNIPYYETKEQYKIEHDKTIENSKVLEMMNRNSKRVNYNFGGVER